jgi:hypothetical protein
MGKPKGNVNTKVFFSSIKELGNRQAASKKGKDRQTGAGRDKQKDRQGHRAT